MSLPRLLGQLRVDSAAPVELRRHRDTMPAPPGTAGRGDARLIAMVSDAGLRGRGGGAFPTGRKMATVAGNTGRPIVVVNGAEGEPASSKDRLLLGRLPHLVLDGALAAAAAVGADEVVVGLDRKAVRSRDAILVALDERHRAGERHVPVALVDLPSRFVAGEESALVHAINGGETKPTGTRQRVFVRGVDRRPTMVSNAETYAHIAQIVQRGPDWFREHGTEDEPGTLLVTMSGDVRRPGVCEVASGSLVADVLAIAGGTNDELQALLVGGYYGAWLSSTDAARSRLINADLRPLGASIGCGALVALPASSCALIETARVLRWMAGETAGQCGPCVHGLPALAGAMDDLATGTGGRQTVANLHRWSTMIDGRGGCTFPDGAVRLVRSTLRVFAADVEHHANHGFCHRVNTPTVMRIPEPEVAWR
ncbi:MAG: NADH-ubiquinone oxidoreductase-F iron-sulfur binding region domain-containing protein [Ilumatobacteraceae bacterium]